jgi:hypothetical protein
MKYSLILLMTLLMSISAFGQNVFGPTYERSDNGFGLRYDRQFRLHDKHGIYVAGGYGFYLRPTTNAYEHYKAQIGYVRYFQNAAEPYWQTGFSAGINGHYYHEIEKGNFSVEKRATFPVSLDLGILFIINQRLVIDWTWDIVKSDCVFGFRYRFGLY